MKIHIKFPFLIVFLINFLMAKTAVASDPCAAGQHADADFKPSITAPAYPTSNGQQPLIIIDSAHNNFHTINGRFHQFAELFRKDGYIVKGSEDKYIKFNKKSLKGVDVLVIANALNSQNVDADNCIAKWKLPTPSALENDEISVIKEWVKEGGSLMLIADHMPFAGAAEKLAAVFGFTLINGYSFPADFNRIIKFNTSDGSLKDHLIIRGRPGMNETVNSITSFLGSAFWIQPMSKAKPLMVLGDGSRTILLENVRDLSQRPSQNSEPSDINMPSVLSAGMFQGATLRYGKGKVAMMGEAGMFTAQLGVSKSGTRKVGLNSPDAEDNIQFALNIMHWLSGALPTSVFGEKK